MSADIKELQELIERERSAEEKVRNAKEESQAILKQAREKAESIKGTAENDPSLEKLKQARQLEIMRKKTEIEEERKRKTSALEKDAQSNFEKAVELLLKETLREKL